MGSSEFPTEEAAGLAVDQATTVSPTPSAFGIGRLRRIPAAGAFGSTSEQLRTWLTSNMDAVGEVTGHSWSAAVADLSTSGAPTALVATSEEGRGVFEADPAESSAESLGRLVTGLVESGSQIAVWLAADPRPEHVAAVAWLNGLGEASFYLIQLEAVRIDNSAPAPWMTLVVRPGRDGADWEPAAAEVSAPTVPNDSWTKGSSQSASTAMPAPVGEPAVEPAAEPTAEPAAEHVAAAASADDPAPSAATFHDEDPTTTALTSISKAPSTAEAPADDNETNPSTFEELVADTGRRVDDWRRIALGAARAADETDERH